MTKIYDLSYPITDRAPCTFSAADKVPTVTFEEGDSHGLHFVTSRVENLYSNAGTQIDFPGHMNHVVPSTSPRSTFPTVGEYPIDRFVGDAIIVDFRWKTARMDAWFSENGLFRRERFGELEEFLVDLESLEISARELREACDKASSEGLSQDVKGVIFLTGCGQYWTYETFESWEYRYFYAPYLSEEAGALLVQSDTSFVGIDAFQIENPITNFRGDELPLMVNPAARGELAQRLRTWRDHSNHELLLSNGILIYESLRIDQVLASTRGLFSGPPLNLQLPGLDDDAVARPYFVV